MEEGKSVLNFCYSKYRVPRIKDVNLIEKYILEQCDSYFCFIFLSVGDLSIFNLRYVIISTVKNAGHLISFRHQAFKLFH